MDTIIILLVVLAICLLILGVSFGVLRLDAERLRRERERNDIDRSQSQGPTSRTPAHPSTRARQLSNPVRARQTGVNSRNTNVSHRSDPHRARVRFGNESQPDTHIRGNPRSTVQFGEATVGASEHASTPISFASATTGSVTCPICRHPVSDNGRELAQCDDCGTKVHIHCWEEHTRENTRPCPMCGKAHMRILM